MPWATEVYGDIFIHGFTSVPHHPASHGCIRTPLTGKNPAHFIFNWLDIGVRVNILADWSDEARDLIALEEGGADKLATDGQFTPPTGIGKPPRHNTATKKPAKKPITIPKPDPTKFQGPTPAKKSSSNG
ncbi:hypothetical protein FYL96_26935 [Salmonella enterica subsp. enterica serovar Typhimurium]|nr:hypothetical protein FYL96_26935 [Salmonella enterica subsp. enterica serovar Typhimurium]